MRLIPLKNSTFKNPADGTTDIPFSYAVTLKMIVEQGSVDGYSIEAVRQSVKIAKAIETAVSEGADSFLLEEAEYNALKSRVIAHKWRLAIKNVVDLVDDIEKAEEVDTIVKTRAA